MDELFWINYDPNDELPGGGAPPTPPPTPPVPPTPPPGGGDKEVTELKRARDEAAEYRILLRSAEGRVRELEITLEQKGNRVTELEGQLSEMETLKIQIAEVNQQRRTVALEKLPENHREKYSAETVSLEEIERAVEVFASLGAGTGNTAGSDPAGDLKLGERPAAELTPDELSSLKASDPEAYRTKLREQTYGNKPKGIFS